MKCDWEALSNNILYGTYWSDLFGNSTIAVASRIWFLGLPLIEKYVLTSAVELPHASAVRLVADPSSLIDWFCLSMCRNVWCLLWHLRHTCFEHVWFLVSGCKQLLQSPDCLTWFRRCFARILRNLLHLKNQCDPLHKENCSCVATLEYDLLTLFAVNCDEREMLGTTFSDWFVWSSSRALHFDSRNVTNSAVVGLSARE